MPLSSECFAYHADERGSPVSTRENIMLRLALVVGLLTTVGCAAPGPKGDAVTLPAIAAGKSRLVFYRPASAIAALDKPNILMDGVVVGTSESGYFTYADVPPGKHLIECKSPDANRITVQTAAGETAYVETSVKAKIDGLQFGLAQKTEAQAKPVIAKLKFRPPTS
jgi:hypothetical protein